MRKRRLITTLFAKEEVSDRRYYSFRSENGKVFYCSVMMPAEAACKYILSNYQIDDIFVIGPENPGIQDSDFQPIVLREGESFYSSELKDLSSYDLLRYRLAQYVDELHADSQDKAALLSEEEQKEAISFLRIFFGKHVKTFPDNKLNRYFHLLAQNQELLSEFYDALRGWAPASDFERYKAWTIHYMYQGLKETAKMELLEGNSDVRVRFETAKKGNALPSIKHLLDALQNSDDPELKDGLDIFLCIQNSEASMILDIMNLINLTRVLPNEKLRILTTITTSHRENALVGVVEENSEMKSISEMMSGASAFLNYGKTDSIVKMWKKANIYNPRIERIIYGMHNIDVGISLCDIGDIERGIKSLRLTLMDKNAFFGNTQIEQLFAVLEEGIRLDYGRLLETDRIEFIDLVKWAYRKEFWQQTLTLIESRAPRDFIERGFFFYCDSEKNREKVARIFGEIYYDLKPFEKYKLEDIPHYYIKFLNREKASHQKRGLEYIVEYAKLRTAELDEKNPEEIKACTVCPDREALENLLFAYYYVGDVRNSTNHAAETFDGFYEIMQDSESSDRMELIRQSIDYFLYCYDKVDQLTKDKKPNVVQITTVEVEKYSNELRALKRFGKGKDS